jgi:2,4-dienoyl-CoA reductase-like NADH-dependent reductase (Old Yellow Enzyme family)
MKSIFDKVTLGKLQLKNRLIRSATWEGLADSDGHMPEALYKIYNELAGGGVGAIITGFTSVADNDYYFGGMARLSNDGLIEEHRRLVGISHSHDCPIIVQLALGEYNGAYRDMDIDRMTAEDISAVREMFISAAVRGEKAGYDGVQIHAAHGFFLSRFISPAFNHRRDEYGGSAENRGRLVVEILKGIKERAPNLHVTMKINCQDFTPCGLTADDSMVICKTCAANGIDSIEVSGGGTSRSGIRAGVNEAYFRDFAAELVETVDVPVILVGGHRSVECMEKVLNDSKIACLSLSRPLVREPNLPNRWQNGDLRPAKCVSCNMCYQTPAHQCIFALRGLDK